MTTSEVQSRVSYWASQYGVPESLALAVAREESGFNPNARSPVGAIGVMQLMPPTAAGLNVNPNDPEQNIQGGVHYLKQMYDQFGSWDLALAAYNAGPGRVAAAGGIPAIPETQSYVAKILGRSEVTEALQEAPQDDIVIGDGEGESGVMSTGAAVMVAAAAALALYYWA